MLYEGNAVIFPLKRLLACAAGLFFALSVTGPASPQPAPPTGFFYGVGLIIPHNLYAGKKSRILPIPMIGYLDQRLQVFGPNISYAVVRDGGFSARLNLNGRFDGFDAKDSDAFIGMDKRSSSVDAGIGLGYEYKDWRVNFSASTDILDKSNGSEMTIELGREFATRQFTFSPSVGVSWQNANLVDYYFGVKTTEASPDRAAYVGTGSVNYHLGLAGSKPMFGGALRANLGVSLYGGAITRSPLVDRNTGYDLFLTYTRFF